MKLLFDQGNSFLKWAESDDGRWQTGRVECLDSNRLRQFLSVDCKDMSTPVEILISSVADEARLTALREGLVERFGLQPRIVRSTASECGVANDYAKPETLGSDRWAALIAVAYRFTAPACIVDCGTAITVDLLDGSRKFRGGTIMPGLQLSRDSLVRGTAQLRGNRQGETNCVARSTADAMQAGTLLGIVGGIERIIDCQQRALGESVTTYLTGGDAAPIAGLLQRPCEVVDDLVLQGLDVISGSSN